MNALSARLGCEADVLSVLLKVDDLRFGRDGIITDEELAQIGLTKDDAIRIGLSTDDILGMVPAKDIDEIYNARRRHETWIEDSRRLRHHFDALRKEYPQKPTIEHLKQIVYDTAAKEAMMQQCAFEDEETMREIIESRLETVKKTLASTTDSSKLNNAAQTFLQAFSPRTRKRNLY